MDSTRGERKDEDGARRGWLRVALFNFLFVAAALGIYFMFYVDSRVEQTTVRNFRALDAAAERLTTLIQNQPKIAANIPFGSDTALAGCNGNDACEGSTDAAGLARVQSNYLDDLFTVIAREDVTIEAASCNAANRSGSCCAPGSTSQRLSRELGSHPVAGDGDVRVVYRDCRPLKARSRYVYAALSDGSSLLDDQSGLRISFSLASLVSRVAGNVAPLFDQFLIVDRDGQVLYDGEAQLESYRYPDVTGARTGRRVRMDFASYLNLKDLVRPAARREASAASQAAQGILGSGGSGASDADGDWERFGRHSWIENLSIADMGFAAFMHPFVIEGLEPLPVEASETSSRNGTTPVSKETELFMVGIINRETLNKEALELRLSFVADALIVIGILFASFSLLWLWTAGDRLVLGAGHFLLFVATGLVTAFLGSLLTLHSATRAEDGAALDNVLRIVGGRISSSFGAELEQRLDTLGAQTRALIEEQKKTFSSEFENRFYCPVVAPLTPPGRYPTFELAFLLNGEGVQVACSSHRRFDTARLALGFRTYFRKPRDGQLWQDPRPAPDGRTPPRFFVERVTSIIDGTIESVVSARPSEMPRSSSTSTPDSLAAAVVIGQFTALEAAILPPHLRFAVVENATGRTLFHSLPSRALATNFVRQVEGDRELLAHIDAGTRGHVDLDYHGTSVRAWVQPLGSGVPWTLVTYRGHELEDTLGIMTVSMTALDVSSVWLILLVALLAGRLLLGRTALRDYWLSWIRTPAELQRAEWWLFTSLLALAVLLAAARFFHPGLVWLVAMLTPFLAFCILIWIAFSARRARTRLAPEEISEPAEDRGPHPLESYVHPRRLLVNSLLMVTFFAVLPTAGSFFVHRAELSQATERYLTTETRRELETKCERYREDARRYKGDYRKLISVEPTATADQWNNVFTFGWYSRTTAVAGERAPPLPDVCNAFPRSRNFWQALQGTGTNGNGPGNSLLEPLYGDLTAFSALALDLFTRLTNDPDFKHQKLLAVLEFLIEPATDASAPGNALRSELAILHDVRIAQLESFLPLALLGFLVMLLALYSLNTRVLGVGIRLEFLPEARISRPPSSWASRGARPMRGCVILRSNQIGRVLQAQLQAARYREIQHARYEDGKIQWHVYQPDPLETPAATEAVAGTDSGTGTEVLYVVENLERLLVEEPARDALLVELERLQQNEASVLLCSRILPGFWLSRLADDVSGDIVKMSDRAVLLTRWSRVIGPLDVRRLVDRRVSIEQRFATHCEDLDPTIRSSDTFASVRAVMLTEARANPELLALAAATAGHVGNPNFVARGSREQAALRRFVAGAAGYFHELWAASSREERLQLFALARGGYANAAEIATLSSLANRNLIQINGLVELRSRAFASFIDHDLVHDRLLLWRDEGHGNLWKSLWPPIALLVVLAVAFFVSSSPEALTPLAALIAAGLGAVPILGGLMRSIRDLKGSDS